MTKIQSDTHSLLLIVTDRNSHQIVAVLPCDGIGPALDKIAGTITHSEEDPTVTFEIVSAVWEEHVALGMCPSEFTFARRHGGIGRNFVFAIFPTAKVGEYVL